MARRGDGVGDKGAGESDEGKKRSSRKSASLVREIPSDERPRERLLSYGAQSLSDAELIAVLLRNGYRDASVLDLSRSLLSDAGGLARLIEADDWLLSRRGIGRVKAATLLAAREIACRLSRARIVRRQLLDRPAALAGYLSMRFGVADQEVLGALYLDVRNRLLAEREVFRGTLSRAAVEPRPILKEALQRNAAGFVIFHTHPSGDPTPSREDLTFTRRMAKAGSLLGVKLIDHLILGSAGRWTSLRRRGVW